ncbi:uncharacterized protein [Branchiostoma lanceolatum]|uniref:uncharacterized protein n=1 Tax=Branchiostoma lanceolatum TaxID=7740 RepID=UPI00345321A3
MWCRVAQRQSVRLRTKWSRVRILSCHRSRALGKGTLHDFPHSTQVTIGDDTTTLQPGEYLDFDVPADEFKEIESTAPVMVVQISTSDSEPYMKTIPPVEFYHDTYTFTTIDLKGPGTHVHKLCIVSQETSGFELNGVPLDPPIVWTPILLSGFSTGCTDISEGGHTLLHSSGTATYDITVSGSSDTETYGFHGGLIKPCPPDPPPPRDCADWFAKGSRDDGIYAVDDPPFDIWCDMDPSGCGGTIIQRRLSGSLDFEREWSDYENGFGDLDGEMWLGLKNISVISSRRSHMLHVLLEDWNGVTAHASYSVFSVGAEDTNYQLTIDAYAGNAGDSMGPVGRYDSSGKMFTTTDRQNDDNTVFNCAEAYSGGGWWYPPGCGYAYLNGKYLTDDCNPHCDPSQGVVWQTWRGAGYSLRKTLMMIRPQAEDCLPPSGPMDCADLFASGERQDGVYSVGHPPFEVYCRMTTLNCGSTILQRRLDGSVDFGRPWSDYQGGFGDPNAEVWMGLEKAHRLTSSSDYQLIIELEDWDGNVAEATYGTFNVGDVTSFYALEIGDFAGDAGDSLAPEGRYNANGQQFSTFDVKNDDNEEFNCATTYSEGGWWYPPGCGYAFLNGKYLKDCNPYCDPSQGVVWHTWKGAGYSLKRSTMMMRPVGFDNTPCIPTTEEPSPTHAAASVSASATNDPADALPAGDGIWDKYLAGDYNPEESESDGNASWTEWQQWKTGEQLPPGYDKNKRPTSGESNTERWSEVASSVYVRRLGWLDNEHVNISTTLEYVLAWIDPRLKGLTASWVPVPPDLVWTPPLSFGRNVRSTSIVDRGSSSDSGISLWLHRSGLIVFRMIRDLHVSCPGVTFEHFPFDSQGCNMPLHGYDGVRFRLVSFTDTSRDQIKTDSAEVVSQFMLGGVQLSGTLGSFLTNVSDCNYFKQSCEYHAESCPFASSADCRTTVGECVMETIDCPEEERRVHDEARRVARSTNNLHKDTNSYTTVSVKLGMTRRLWIYISTTFIPSFILVVASLLQTWLPLHQKAISGRITLGVIPLLVMISKGVLKHRILWVSVARALDIWLIVCLVFILLALMETIVVYYIYSRREEKLEHPVEKKSRKLKICIPRAKYSSPLGIWWEQADGEGWRIAYIPSTEATGGPSSAAVAEIHPEPGMDVSRSPIPTESNIREGPPRPQIASGESLNLHGEGDSQTSGYDTMNTTGKSSDDTSSTTDDSMETDVTVATSDVIDSDSEMNDPDVYVYVSQQIDHVTRIVFVGAFSIFNICFWSYYLFIWSRGLN